MSWLESRIPPPAVALAAAVFMWALARATPARSISIPGRVALASVVALAGAAIVLSGVLAFRRARTTLTPLNPGAASALVVSRIYRYTRNPMYLGMAIVLVAWAVCLSHPLSLLGVVAFAAYVQRFQIVPEEKALRALFPGAFDAYTHDVRRWI